MTFRTGWLAFVDFFLCQPNLNGARLVNARAPDRKDGMVPFGNSPSAGFKCQRANVDVRSTSVDVFRCGEAGILNQDAGFRAAW